jgi:hypothetical protein
LGIVVEMKQMSAKGRLEKKKYMVVWRWESELTGRMISTFPRTITRYIDQNSPKRMSCSHGSSESSFRWNSEIHVILFLSVFSVPF